MREAISIMAIAIAFVYFIAFGAAVYVALESQMHWALAFIAFAALILLRLWPALPVLAWLGAHNLWNWPWYWSGLLALPIAFYVASHYWTLASDLFHRPGKTQGA